MRKTLNKEFINGRVHDHNLAEKVTGEGSKNPGTSYIGGSLDIATDEDGVNIVTVNFTYVTKVTSKGRPNSTYIALKEIIDSGKTILNVGKVGALKVSVDTAIGVNDFYTNRNGEDELVSTVRNEGGFVTIESALKPEPKRNRFECDALLVGSRYVEKDPEKHIDEDYLVIKAAVFNFRNDLMPVEFVVRDPDGIKYFEGLDLSQKNYVFTKIWGEIKRMVTVVKNTTTSAFGGVKVDEYERKTKEWVITGAAEEPYPLEDDKAGITASEIQLAISTREQYLAEVKKRAEEYRNSQASTTQASAFGGAAAKASEGGFTF